ncbi:MAG: hypothetical protein IKK75_12385 [Clostridia bacterium]|nr:hypothetical protein [Clostridia bacterium]
MVQSSAATFTTPIDAAAILLMALLPLALAAVMMFAWCRLFKKAGLPWERMFVPVYGAYWTYEIADCGYLYWSVIGSFFIYALLGSQLSGAAATLASVAYLAAVIVIQSLYCAKLARAFGKGKGFAVGLVLLFPIFVMILAFGQSTYQR